MNAEHREAFLISMEQTGRCEVIVHGMSMWPFLRRGDSVLLRRPRGLPRPGQVVAFFANEQMVVHRVTRVRAQGSSGSMIEVCGDSSPGSRGSLYAEDILGVVASAKRRGVCTNRWLTTPWGLIVLPLGAVLRFAARLRVMKS